MSDEEKGLRCNLQKVSHGVEEIVFYGYGNVTHGWGATCYGTGVLDFFSQTTTGQRSIFFKSTDALFPAMMYSKSSGYPYDVFQI